MIDLNNGIVRISDDLCIAPQFSFDDFKKTSFYNNHDGIRAIYIEKQQSIDSNNYMVSLIFRNNQIYMLSLVCCSKQYSEKNEKERKELHDEILKIYGVVGKKEFAWGKVSSDYDARGNCSSINIIYF